MTALHSLRLAAAEQQDGDLKRLLTWAELHIGDQYERICELEDELKQADTENQRRANALNAVRAALDIYGQLIAVAPRGLVCRALKQAQKMVNDQLKAAHKANQQEHAA